jgi:hypothetical protein
MWSASQWLCYLIVALDITQPAILSALSYWCCVQRTRAVVKAIIAYNKARYPEMVRFLATPHINWRKTHLVTFSRGPKEFGPTLEMSRRSINRCREIVFYRRWPLKRIGFNLEERSVKFFLLDMGDVVEELTETRFYKELNTQEVYYQ